MPQAPRKLTATQCRSEVAAQQPANPAEPKSRSLAPTPGTTQQGVATGGRALAKNQGGHLGDGSLRLLHFHGELKRGVLMEPVPCDRVRSRLSGMAAVLALSFPYRHCYSAAT